MFTTLFYTNFHRMHTLFYTNFPRSVAVVHDNRFPILFIMIDCLHILPQFLVERMLRHRVFIAEDDELHAGSRHRHVHAAEVFQESDLSLVVGTYQRDEDHVSFLPLETVHRVYADQAAVRLEELILLDGQVTALVKQRQSIRHFLCR